MVAQRKNAPMKSIRFSLAMLDCDGSLALGGGTCKDQPTIAMASSIGGTCTRNALAMSAKSHISSFTVEVMLTIATQAFASGDHR